MKIQEKLKKLDKTLGLNEEKGYVAGVLIALIVVSSIVAGYYLLQKPTPEGYNTIYLLDAQKKAVNYPELVVTNENSTFNVFVNVENHMAETEKYQVLQKITSDLSTLPVNVTADKTYEVSLESGGTWQDSATVSLNQVGNYSVVFELWMQNPVTGAFEFTHNFCVLNIQVVAG